jgi:hypothetical protein
MVTGDLEECNAFTLTTTWSYNTEDDGSNISIHFKRNRVLAYALGSSVYDKVQWQTLANTAMDLPVPKYRVYVLLSEHPRGHNFLIRSSCTVSNYFHHKAGDHDSTASPCFLS